MEVADLDGGRVAVPILAFVPFISYLRDARVLNTDSAVGPFPFPLPFSFLFFINVTSLLAFQSLRCSLAISPSVPPRAALNPSRGSTSRAGRSGQSAIPAETETGHLLFPHSDMKRHFYFCRSPAGGAARVAGISMPHSSRTEGFIVGFKASYNMNIAAAAAVAIFKELRLSPSFPPLFQFSLYSSPNRLARDSLTRTGAAPLCLAARYSLVILMRAYRPLVSGSSVAARRGSNSRDVAESRSHSSDSAISADNYAVTFERRSRSRASRRVAS